MKRNARKDRLTKAFRHSQLEGLENRQLMVADVRFDDGILSMHGTNRTIMLRSLMSKQGKKSFVHVGGQSKKFPRQAVTKIIFDGGDGDDTFENRTNIDSVATGGGGNDRLTGGSGNDKISGDDGNDRNSGEKVTTNFGVAMETIGSRVAMAMIG